MYIYIYIYIYKLKHDFKRYKDSTLSRRSKFITKHMHKNIQYLFTNPSARAGYDTRSIFKRSF